MIFSADIEVLPELIKKFVVAQAHEKTVFQMYINQILS